MQRFAHQINSEKWRDANTPRITITLTKTCSDKTLILRLFTFVCVCARLPAFVSLFREPEICACLRLRTFAHIRLRLQTPPLLHPPFAAP